MFNVGECGKTTMKKQGLRASSLVFSSRIYQTDHPNPIKCYVEGIRWENSLRNSMFKRFAILVWRSERASIARVKSCQLMREAAGQRTLACCLQA